MLIINLHFLNKLFYTFRNLINLRRVGGPLFRVHTQACVAQGAKGEEMGKLIVFLGLALNILLTVSLIVALVMDGSPLTWGRICIILLLLIAWWSALKSTFDFKF